VLVWFFQATSACVVLPSHVCLCGSSKPRVLVWFFQVTCACVLICRTFTANAQYTKQLSPVPNKQVCLHCWDLLLIECPTVFLNPLPLVGWHNNLLPCRNLCNTPQGASTALHIILLGVDGTTLTPEPTLSLQSLHSHSRAYTLTPHHPSGRGWHHSHSRATTLTPEPTLSLQSQHSHSRANTLTPEPTLSLQSHFTTWVLILKLSRNLPPNSMYILSTTLKRKKEKLRRQLKATL